MLETRLNLFGYSEPSSTKPTSDAYDRLNKLASKNEQLLVEYMLRYSKDGSLITLAELQSINGSAKPDDVDFINSLFYQYCVKEISQRHLPKLKSHDLPWATAQARALMLIKEGYLDLSDVFKEDAKYGVFTVKPITEYTEETLKKILERFFNINRRYNELILKKEHMYLWEDFSKAHSAGILTVSGKKYHQELEEAFGGQYDSVDDSHKADEEFSTTPPLKTSPADIKSDLTKERQDIFAAAEKGDLKQIRAILHHSQYANDFLISRRDDKGNSPLLLSAANNKLALVQWLVTNGPENFLVRNNEGMTPLLLAAKGGHTDLLDWLLRNGAKYNDQDGQGNTILMWAVIGGHAETIKQIKAIKEEALWSPSLGDFPSLPEMNDKGQTVADLAKGKGVRKALDSFPSAPSDTPSSPAPASLQSPTTTAPHHAMLGQGGKKRKAGEQLNSKGDKSKQARTGEPESSALSK